MGMIIKCTRGLFFISLFIWLITAALAVRNSIVYPEFNKIPPIIASITAISGVTSYFMKKGTFSIFRGAIGVLLTIFLLGGIQVLSFLATLLNPREGQFETTSPGGEHTIVIEYDLASRPFLYYKRSELFMYPIPFEFGPGYNERVCHVVDWKSETNFELSDYLGNVWDVDISSYVK